MNPPREPRGVVDRESPVVPPRRRRSGGGAVFLLLFVGGAAGAVWLHAHLSGTPLWAVRSVTVTGNRSLQVGELLERLDLRPGMPWWRVRSRAGALEAAEPRLASVEVSWRWPRDLVVQVRERQAFLRLLTEPPCELAADGMLYARDDDLDPLDLPLLTGALPASLGPRQRLRLEDAETGFAEFLNLARSAPDAWKCVSEVHYAGGRDFQVYLRGGRRVILWETGINDKLKRSLPEVLRELDRRGLEDVVVDLRFRDQVVLRQPAAADSANPQAASGKPDGRGGRKSAISAAARADQGRSRA
jgi:hypothetical protein